MDNETVLNMDANILLSMVNLKLRDYYSSLNAFCDDLGIDKKKLEDRLKDVGYIYNKDLNQFR